MFPTLNVFDDEYEGNSTKFGGSNNIGGHLSDAYSAVKKGLGSTFMPIGRLPFGDYKPKLQKSGIPATGVFDTAYSALKGFAGSQASRKLGAGVASMLPLGAGIYEGLSTLRKNRADARRQIEDIAWSSGTPRAGKGLYNDYLNNSPSIMGTIAKSSISSIPSMFGTYGAVYDAIRKPTLYERATNGIENIAEGAVNTFRQNLEDAKNRRESGWEGYTEKNPVAKKLSNSYSRFKGYAEKSPVAKKLSNSYSRFKSNIEGITNKGFGEEDVSNVNNVLSKVRKNHIKDYLFSGA